MILSVFCYLGHTTLRGDVRAICGHERSLFMGAPPSAMEVYDDVVGRIV